ncbi:MAG: pyridoxal phosphate-dependent aminotransferase [Bacteroidales bacterium]
MKNATSNIPSPVKEYFFVGAQRQKQELIRQGRRIADLSIGNPDLPPSTEVLNRLKESLSHPANHGYQPNAGSKVLRNSITSWYDRFFAAEVNPDDEVIPLQGSRQGIIQLSQALLKPGDEVLVPDPGYPSYSFAAKMMGANAVSYSLNHQNDFLPDLKNLQNSDLSRVKIMWVNYPHMPTGAKALNDTFEQLVLFARENNILIVNDNAYAFVRNNSPKSILSVAGAKDVALELNSLSKNYNLAGWRLGFLAGNAALISHLSQLKSHLDSGIALPLQHAAAAALDLGYKWFAPLNNAYNARAKSAKKLAQAMGCIPAGGDHGMFLWVKMPETGMTSADFDHMLLHEAGVLLAPGSLFGKNGEGHLRISLCASEEQFEIAMENLNKSSVFNLKYN